MYVDRVDVQHPDLNKALALAKEADQRNSLSEQDQESKKKPVETDYTDLSGDKKESQKFWVLYALMNNISFSERLLFGWAYVSMPLSNLLHSYLE